MANKRIETARKELDKWTAKVSEMTQAVSEKETTLASIESSLGELVISGGDAAKAQAEMERIQKELRALHAGLQAANQKVTQARKDLETLERAELEATVRANSTKAGRLLVEILEMLEALADKETELANLAAETTRIKQTHDIRISFGYYAPTWFGHADKLRALIRSLKHAYRL